jgi:hypothetical protein
MEAMFSQGMGLKGLGAKMKLLALNRQSESNSDSDSDSESESGSIRVPSLEAGSNTSTVTLRVVGDDEKGT